MAKQTGLLGITGTVGGMTFTKDGVVRKAVPSNKSHFDSAVSMERTRENATEFGQAATAGKLLRQALRRQIQRTGDRAMIARLTQAMRAIESLDSTNVRGKRRVLKANVDQLVGFNFNEHAPLSTVFFASFVVAVSAAGVLTLTFPTLVPRTDMIRPLGATHFALEIGVVVLDFEANLARTVLVTGIPTPSIIDGVPLPSLVLTANLGAVPGATETMVVALGVNYFQQINGQFYPLQDESTNPLGIVYAQ